MRKAENIRLSENFMLYEFIEAQMPFEAIALNWTHFDQTNILGWQLLAKHLQKFRGLINDNFKSDIGFADMGLRITSGFRCREWELLRGRSGDSQHCIGYAADIQPTNCSREQAAKIIHWLYSKHNEYWQNGLAIKYPSREGNILLIGFLHLDIRGKRARWTYD